MFPEESTLSRLLPPPLLVLFVWNEEPSTRTRMVSGWVERSSVTPTGYLIFQSSCELLPTRTILRSTLITPVEMSVARSELNEHKLAWKLIIRRPQRGEWE